MAQTTVCGEYVYANRNSLVNVRVHWGPLNLDSDGCSTRLLQVPAESPSPLQPGPVTAGVLITATLSPTSGLDLPTGGPSLGLAG